MTICKRYVESSEYHEDAHHEIHHYPNGGFYNHYDVQKDRCIKYRPVCIAGPFSSFEDAHAMMKKHRPAARML